MQNYDVIVVGAGISGIDAAHNLNTRCPGLSFALLERRTSFGGTWDLFKYPGVRSDSDMFTFGYDFRPWKSVKPFASGAEILEYLEETIQDCGLAQYILYGHHIVSAKWSSESARWKLLCENGARFQCRFLFCCAGYYDFDQGWEPEFPGAAVYKAAGGQIVHPQKWCEKDIRYKDKKVVIIGSGATAVTLLPAIAQDAARVTMLQRSPSYIIPLRNLDPIAVDGIEQGLSKEEIHRRVREHRVKMMTEQEALGQEMLSQQQKNAVFINYMRQALPKKYMSDDDFKKHFTPKYNIWEQRLCVAPDSNLFRAIRRKQAFVVTGHIKHFDERGVRLESGEHIEADLIVTATGLELHRNFPMATIQVTIDGKPYVAPENVMYKDCMLSNVPNFAFCRGYFKDSWTLKADLVCHFVCRVVWHMRSNGLQVVQPRLPAEGAGEEPPIDISSGYILRSLPNSPKYGSREPWLPLFSYANDKVLLEEASLADGVLEFGALRSRL